VTKLIIWHLDDTLWRGTLAEGDEVTLDEHLATAVRTLNEQGVVNAICSKNDLEAAKAKLEEFGLWDAFLFPEISFTPKGAGVARIISDMQLRPHDVVFVDDNPVNLREVGYALPDIRVIDATTTQELHTFLADLARSTEGGTSRVERYRLLERKRSDQTASAGSNEEFLRTCAIKMTVVERSDNLPYAERIEELINRTNQLNYTKSRVEPGSMQEEIVATSRNFTYSAFVWDRYGDYGLVGFASVRHRRVLEHFLFSCRTMNMGIESAMAAVVSQRTFVTEYPVPAELPDWIELVPQDSEEFAAHAASTLQETGDAEVRIMANCQSAALAHYLPGIRASFDNYPRVFTLAGFHRHQYFPGKLANTLVYGAFVDYDQSYWGGVPGLDEYEAAARGFVAFAAEKDSELVVLLPPEAFSNENEASGQTPERYAAANNIWRGLAETHDRVSVVEIADHVHDTTVQDPRHFDRDLLVSLSLTLAQRLGAARA